MGRALQMASRKYPNDDASCIQAVSGRLLTTTEDNPVCYFKSRSLEFSLIYTLSIVLILDIKQPR